jgi:predicted signal transduction protein with EAL and GGDEF domain
LPDDRRFTASFGVAELRCGEGISDLMRRADEALYDAKKGGRDCVRVFAAQERGLSNVAGRETPSVICSPLTKPW